jgi:hypothetical protein
VLTSTSLANYLGLVHLQTQFPIRVDCPRRKALPLVGICEKDSPFFCGAKCRYWPKATVITSQRNVRFRAYSDRRSFVRRHVRREARGGRHFQSHALSHDAPASMRTRTPLGIASVCGFECTAHPPFALRTCCPRFVVSNVGSPSKCHPPSVRASDRARTTSNRRRDERRSRNGVWQSR